MVSLRRFALKGVKALSAATDPVLGGRRVGPRLLIYHQIGAGSGLEMDVPFEAFAAQLNWLRMRHGISSLDDVLDASGDDPDRYVLTFDDGHVGVYDEAYPLLSELGIPFTLYLSTHPLETGAPLHGDSRMPLMTWTQIEDMVDSGLATIGSHSHRHLDMRMCSEEEIADDLATCDELLEERLGLRPRHFAYPWGHWSPAADGVVRTRYESAVVGSGAAIRPESDPYRLSRLPVMLSDTLPFFRRKMWGGFRLETVLRSARDSQQRPSETAPVE